MAICPKCDIEYEESKNYCIKCGTPLLKKPVGEEEGPKFQLVTSPFEEIQTPDTIRKKLGRGKKIVWGGAGFVVLVIAVLFFIFIPKIYNKKSPELPVNQEFLTLLNRAGEYIAADKLTSPPGENAYEIVTEILSRDPGNEKALQLQKEIVARYAQWGDENYNGRDFQKALTYYRKASSIDDSSIEIREKIAQTERMLKEQQLLEETNRKIAEQKRLSDLNIYLPLFNSKVVEKVVSLGYTPYEILFLDNFESNQNEWPVEDSAGGPFLQVKNGRLTLEERTKNQAYWISKRLVQDDFIVRFSMKYESGTDDNGAGIYFRAKSLDDYRYFISLDAAGDCYYQIGFFSGKEKKWSEIKEWTKTEIIHSKQENKVEAIVVGDKIHLFINAELIASASGIKNASGNFIGFFTATSSMRYSFDDLCFIGLKKRS